jgi:hypothetical protein
LLLSFAATFAGSVALAASTPVREHVRDAFSFVRSGVPDRADVGARSLPKGGPHRAAPPAPAALAPPAALAEEAPAEVLSVDALPLSPSSPSPVSRREDAARPEPLPASVRVEVPPASGAFPVEPSVPVAPRAAPGMASADLALYQRAHALHFGGADRTLALAAWDGYLKAFPRGTFAPEARLNRAVCLAKLGRTAEAEGVLGEIERGRFGKDGRRQARKILGVLSD